MIGALLALLFASTAQAAVVTLCDQKTDGLQLCVPRIGTSFDHWSRATKEAFDKVNSSGAVATAEQDALGRVYAVSSSSAAYQTLTAALVAIGTPAVSATIMIDAGTYTEPGPLVIPSNVFLNSLSPQRQVTLNFSTSSPAINFIGNSSLRNIRVINSAGPGVFVSGPGSTRFRMENANAQGTSYGLRISSAGALLQRAVGTGTAGHGFLLDGTSSPDSYDSYFETFGGGHAMFVSGGGSGAFYNTSFDGTTGFAAIMLNNIGPRLQGAAICAKVGQHAIDAASSLATFPIGSGLITYTNACGGGLSQTHGNNVVFLANQAIGGVAIRNAGPPAGSILVAESTSSSRWINAPLAIDEPNQRVGIGTTTPSGTLAVVDSNAGPSNGGGYNEVLQAPGGNFIATSSGVIIRASGIDGVNQMLAGTYYGMGYQNGGGVFTGICHDGPEDAPTNCKSGGLVTFIGAKPYDGTTTHDSFSSKAAIQMTAAEDSAVGANGTNISLDTTLIGTSTRRQRVKVYDTGRTAIAPRANVVTPLGLLHLQGTDSGIGITGNGVSLYATEAVVSLTSVTAPFIAASTTQLNGVTYKWPLVDGSINQVLSTDGSGNLSFQTPSGSTSAAAGLASTQTFTGLNTFLQPITISSSIAFSSTTPGGAPIPNALYADNMIRAWAIIVGTGTAWVPASFNVSSFSDLGTGLYQITLATPMQSLHGYDNGTASQYVILCSMYRTDVTNNDTCGPFASGTTYFGNSTAAFNSSTEGGGDQDGIVFGVILGGRQ